MAESDFPATAEAPDLLRIIRSPHASRELKSFAARGLLPMESQDRLRAMLAVADDGDPEVGPAAVDTLKIIPPDELVAFLNNADPSEMELDIISRHIDDHAVLERIVRSRSVADMTLGRLAGFVVGAPQEALIVNQVRLLREPALIDALLGNPELTADGRRRLLELKEEFFEKEERRREQERQRAEEEERRAKQEAAGIVFDEGEESEAAATETGEISAAEDQTAEDFNAANLSQVFRRIANMNVKERMSLAQKGTKEERRILIADANKIVSMAVLKCESLTAAEVETFCTMRHLATEIFQEIAATREWLKRPKIQLALVRNPAVPLAITLPLIKYLNMRDLRNITRDRNLPEGVRTTAQKILFEKRG